MNFKQFYIMEMPHTIINGMAIDFEIEKPGWNKKLIEFIKKTKNIEELLKPFYYLCYNKILLKRFNELNKEEQDELLKILPNKFKYDMKLLKH